MPSMQSVCTSNLMLQGTWGQSTMSWDDYHTRQHCHAINSTTSYTCHWGVQLLTDATCMQANKQRLQTTLSHGIVGI